MNETYAMFKKFCNDNHYVNFTKALNSAQTTKETRESMKPIVRGTSHCGNLIIHNDICYTTFIHNYGDGADDPFDESLVLEFASFPLERVLADDFDIDKDMNVICFDKSPEITGHITNKTSCFKSNSMCLVGDDIYITLGCETNGNCFKLYRVKYDTNTGKMTPATELKLRYTPSASNMPTGASSKFEAGVHTNVYTLDEQCLNKIYQSEGYDIHIEGSEIEATSKWSEYNGAYYTTIGPDANTPGIIVKTYDFKVLWFVSVIKENTYTGGCEIASHIHDGEMYIACRQTWGSTFLLFTRYNLVTGKWLESYCIEDGVSRPWFFEYKDDVYLFNTIEESFRRYANISKVRTLNYAYNRRNAPIDTVASIYQCGSYNSFYVYKDRIFFVASYEAEINFGELKLKQNDPVAINDKLIKLLGE